MSKSKDRSLRQTSRDRQENGRFSAHPLHTYSLRKWDLCQTETWQLPLCGVATAICSIQGSFSPSHLLSLPLYHSSGKAGAGVNWLWCIFRCEKNWVGKGRVRKQLLVWPYFWLGENYILFQSIQDWITNHIHHITRRQNQESLL